MINGNFFYSVSYTYRPDGLRYGKMVNSTSTQHLWDGGNIIVDFKNGAVESTYLRGSQIISSGSGSSLRYYMYNGHGDVVQLVNTSGQVVTQYDYDAFGNQKGDEEDIISDADKNSFRYCAEYFDKETQAIYLRARYYKSAYGRFTQEDPIRSGSNWYSYGRGNPIRFVDPWGLADFDIRSLAQTYGWTVTGYSDHVSVRDANGKKVSLYNIRYEEGGRVYADGSMRQVLINGLTSNSKSSNSAGGSTTINDVFSQTVSGMVEGVLGFGISISSIVSIVSNSYSPYIESNYISNSKYTFDSYIYTQNSGAAAKMNLGYYDTKEKGCGWIAAYNAGLLLGEDYSPADLVLYHETHGGAILNGILGINPLANKTFFQEQGIPVDMYNLPTNIDAKITESTVSILTYLDFDGETRGHHITIQDINGTYYVYNENKPTAPDEFSSIDAWIKKHKYNPLSLLTLR